jgi:hypothetical protein
MLRGLKERYPKVHLKAFTATEIDHLVRLSKKSLEQTLRDLIDAGLDSLPGGGAEIFADRVWNQVCSGKAKPERWLEIHRVAHGLGLRSTATMLYGHIETDEERVDHMLRIRALQDETGGFTAFIPLAFHPENTRLDRIPKATVQTDLKVHAVARLVLDNVDHLKAYWIMCGLKTAQMLLSFAYRSNATLSTGRSSPPLQGGPAVNRRMKLEGNSMNRRMFVPMFAAAALLGAVDAAAQETELIHLEFGARVFMGENDGRLKNIGGSLKIDEDLDAGGDTFGMGLSLTGLLKGGNTFNVQGWQYSSDGENTIEETTTFGGITLAAGTSADTEIDIRQVSAKFCFGITDPRQPYRIGLGIAGKVIDWKTEVINAADERETQKMRMIYPSAEIEVSYRVGEAVMLKAEGGLGMPAFAKGELEIQYPIEVRAGLQIALGGFTVEGGFQVYDALLVEHENQPEEQSANVNLTGIYFELAARW